MEETHQILKVSRSTMQKWEKQQKETRNLEKKELHRSFRKIDPEKRKEYVWRNIQMHTNRKWQRSLDAVKEAYEMHSDSIRARFESCACADYAARFFASWRQNFESGLVPARPARSVKKFGRYMAENMQASCVRTDSKQALSGPFPAERKKGRICGRKAY